MQLLIQDKDGNILPLFLQEDFFKIKAIPNNIRSNKLDRYQQRGSILQGDLKSGSRNIEFMFNILADNDADFRYRLNLIASFFKKNKRPYYLVDSTNQIRTEVYGTDLIPTWSPGVEYRVSDNILRMDMLDAIWEDLLETEQFTTLTNGTSMTVEINPICEEFFFEAEFTGLVANPRFAFNNLTTGGSFLCEKSTFTTNDILIVDGRGKGRVSYNGNIEKRILTGGIYFPLVPGQNVLQYQSNFGSIDVKIKYRQKYLY
jgi:hypothetical protein